MDFVGIIKSAPVVIIGFLAVVVGLLLLASAVAQNFPELFDTF